MKKTLFIILVMFFAGCTIAQTKYPYNSISVCMDYDGYSGIGIDCYKVFNRTDLLYVMTNYDYTVPFNTTSVLLINNQTSTINERTIVHDSEGTHWMADPLYNDDLLPAGVYEYIILVNGFEKARTSFEVIE